MGSKHQQFYKGRGNFRPRPGIVAGIAEDYNSFSALDNPNRGRFGNRYQRGNANQRFNRGGRNVQFQRQNFSDGQPQTSSQRVVSAPWSKITIVNGRACGLAFLLRELSNYVDGSLAPVFPQYNDNNLEFHLQDNEMAQAVQSASRRITTPSGQKVVIIASKVKAPLVPLCPTEVELLQRIIHPRYDAINSSLNLSQIAEDPLTRQERCSYMPISRGIVALAVANMIGVTCPDLKQLDCSRNKIRYLDGMATVMARCPNVQKLNLSQNLIENVKELEKLFMWKETLVELDLEPNPFCQRYHEKAPYTAAVRRIFPKLQRLDGSELSPVFKTGLEEELTSIAVYLPPIKESFFVNEQFKTMCTRFIDEYFLIFDEAERNKREKLLQAYDEEVTFTMTAFNLTEEALRIRTPCWNELIRDSHNVKTSGVWEKYRAKLVHKGRLSVVSFFVKDFPIVQHDRSTFVVDVSFATDNLMCLNVSGLHRVKTASHVENGTLRFFNRIFLLIPKNDGLAVVNEQLFVTTFTPQQELAYRDMYTVTNGHQTPQSLLPMDQNTSLAHFAGPSSSSSRLNGGTTGASLVASTSSSVGQVLTLANHKTLIDEFSRQSGMKANWAEKCLEDCNWNFEQAALTFAELKKIGGIPPEAFA